MSASAGGDRPETVVAPTTIPAWLRQELERLAKYPHTPADERSAAGHRAELREILKRLDEAAAPPGDDLYYLQDTRSYNGDFLIWWRPERCGYTATLARAGLYSKAEAEDLVAKRSDAVKAWPRAEAEALACPAVHAEHVRLGKASKTVAP